jgi:O-acetylhomoserine (thiol)-lyase
MKLETRAIHAGYSPDPTTKAVAVPIYQTTSYAFDNTQHGADLFDLKVEGNIYTRIMNPTNAVLEQRVAEMEGGIAGLAVSSGMAAITYAIENIARVGDNIVTTSQLYGGTYNFFAHALPARGVEVRFVSHEDLEGMAAKIDDRTRAVFCETVGNPSGNVMDIEGMAKIAHDAGVPLMVDNTVPTPYLWRPIEQGADIVIHSLTKYMGGHGTTVAGVIVDSGRFPWAKYPEKYPMLNEPDPSYHGVVFTEALGEAAFIGRARVGPLRNTGSALSPFNAFLILQGIETLPVRMDRHCENAQKVAEYLEAHPQVNWVKFAGLKSSPDYRLAQKYMNGRAASIMSFGIDGGAEGGAKFIDALQLITRLVNIGDAKSLACHPATTTHRQLNDEELASAGVSRDMVRLSIGLEHVDDIIADIEQALKAAA